MSRMPGAVIAIARELGIDDSATQKAMEKFTGVNRRFTRLGKVRLPKKNGETLVEVELVDDYGHHPSEMAATIAAARGAYPNKRLVLAFQPHRYTRTRDLFEDFVKVLSGTDVLLLGEVYPAGEQPIVAADGRSLARAIPGGRKSGSRVCRGYRGDACRHFECDRRRRYRDDDGGWFDQRVSGKLVEKALG